MVGTVVMEPAESSLYYSQDWLLELVLDPGPAMAMGLCKHVPYNPHLREFCVFVTLVLCKFHLCSRVQTPSKLPFLENNNSKSVCQDIFTVISLTTTREVDRGPWPCLSILQIVKSMPREGEDCVKGQRSQVFSEIFPLHQWFPNTTSESDS